VKKDKAPKRALYYLNGPKFVALLEEYNRVFIRASTLVNSYLLLNHLIANKSLIENFELETSSLSNVITDTLYDLILEGVELNEEINKLGTPIKEH